MNTTIKINPTMSVTIEIDKDENTLRYKEVFLDVEPDTHECDEWPTLLSHVSAAADAAGMKFAEGPDEYKSAEGWRYPRIRDAA